MAIQALGYIGLGSAKLDDWSDFAGGVLGLQPVDRGGGMRAFRMDDRKQRLIVDAALPDGDRVFGWEVENALELDVLAARLEAAGVAVRQEGAGRAAQRCVANLISFVDPAGNRLEAFCGPQVADTAFCPGRDISGFRTGPLGMGAQSLLVTPRNGAPAERIPRPARSGPGQAPTPPTGVGPHSHRPGPSMNVDLVFFYANAADLSGWPR